MSLLLEPGWPGNLIALLSVVGVIGGLMWRIAWRNRYIQTGDRIALYQSDKLLGKVKVRVKGWGKYAAVSIGNGYIRRDCIRKDVATGEWFYRYED